jgi:hypothetical protein
MSRWPGKGPLAPAGCGSSRAAGPIRSARAWEVASRAGRQLGQLGQQCGATTALDPDKSGPGGRSSLNSYSAGSQRRRWSGRPARRPKVASTARGGLRRPGSRGRGRAAPDQAVAQLSRQLWQKSGPRAGHGPPRRWGGCGRRIAPWLPARAPRSAISALGEEKGPSLVSRLTARLGRASRGLPEGDAADAGEPEPRPAESYSAALGRPRPMRPAQRSAR